MEIIIIILVALMLLALAAILVTQNKILKTLSNIRIPAPQKIEFPKIEFPKIEFPKMEFPKIEIPKVEIPPVEIPPAKEYNLDLNPVIEVLKNIQIPAPQKEGSSVNAEVLHEIASLMRVNQAELQSSLEVFHKAIDKLLTQIPNGEKELNSQKEFVQKFEEAMRKAQETAAEAMSENSLRLQEILAEVLNKEQKG
jgi:hypothetical protein